MGGDVGDGNEGTVYGGGIIGDEGDVEGRGGVEAEAGTIVGREIVGAFELDGEMGGVAHNVPRVGEATVGVEGEVNGGDGVAIREESRTAGDRGICKVGNAGEELEFLGGEGGGGEGEDGLVIG